MTDGEHESRDLQSSSAPAEGAETVVETRIVSPKGARVTETVFVLSSRACRQLEIRGEVPPWRVSGSGWRPTNAR